LDSRPRLFDDLVVDFNIFIELSESRDWDSMAGMPKMISFTEIEAYLRLHAIIDQLQQQRLIKRLKILDNIFCEYYRKKHGGHTDNTRRKIGDKGSGPA